MDTQHTKLMGCRKCSFNREVHSKKKKKPPLRNKKDLK